jgi:O-acetylserine/cysteine efflux transporter
MNSSRRLVFPALISAGVLWGTTVPLSKVALAWLPPAGLAFVRFALAGGLLMAVSRSRLRAAASPAILVSGALGYGGSVVLQNFGIERTSVTHAALLIGATPVLVAVLAAVCGHGVARPAAWVGFALSLAGVAVIAAGKGGGASAGGDGLVLAGQLASAVFTVSQARLLRGRDPVAVTGLQLMAAAVVTLPVTLMTGGLHAGPASPGVALATAALIVAGTVGPTTLFTFAQTRVSADVAGAFLNLEPLVGAIAGTVLFADPLGPVQLAGGAAILVGIGLSSMEAIRGGLAVAAHAARPPRVRAGGSPDGPGRPVATSRWSRASARRPGSGGTARHAGYPAADSVSPCGNTGSRPESAAADSPDWPGCTPRGRQAARGHSPAGPSWRTPSPERRTFPDRSRASR